MKSFTIFSILAVLAVACYGQITTPEPPTVTDAPVDPVRPTVPVLYLSTAGKLPLTETKLASFTTVKICPSDYPTGWTLRCDTKSTTSVIFRVKTAIYKKEFFPPFYISGNWKESDAIRPYDMGSDTMQRIACRVRTRKAVWVDIMIEC